MKTNFRFIIFSSALLITFSACKKGDSNSASSKAALLAKAPWIMVSEQQKQLSQTTWTDSYATMQACQKDNRYVFNSNGAYEINEGSTKCSSSSPQIIETGTWTLTAAQTGFTLVSSGGTQDITIESLSESTLSVSFTTHVYGLTYDVKETFTH